MIGCCVQRRESVSEEHLPLHVAFNWTDLLLVCVPPFVVQTPEKSDEKYIYVYLSKYSCDFLIKFDLCVKSSLHK